MNRYGPAVFFLVACVFTAAVLFDAYRLEFAADAFRREIEPYPHNRNLPEDIYEKFYDSLGPASMIDIIDERNACHLEGHNLGRVMYERSGNLPLSMTQCGSKCYNGCADGILIGFVEGERDGPGGTRDPQPEDLTPKLIEKILSLCDPGEVTRAIGFGGCYHALGHVFAYFTDSNIAESLSLCRMLETRGDGAIFHCAAGMYMQRSGDYSEPDIASSPSRLYPCDTEDYPAACYRYRIPVLYGSSTPLETIARHCDALPEPDKSACFHGIGTTYYNRPYKNPEIINSMCATTEKLALRMCLDGVLGRLSTYGIDGGDRICDVVQGMTKDECLQSVESIYSQRRDYSSYLVPR